MSQKQNFQSLTESSHGFIKVNSKENTKFIEQNEQSDEFTEQNNEINNENKQNKNDENLTQKRDLVSETFELVNINKHNAKNIEEIKKQLMNISYNSYISALATQRLIYNIYIASVSIATFYIYKKCNTKVNVDGVMLSTSSLFVLINGYYVIDYDGFLSITINNFLNNQKEKVKCGFNYVYNTFSNLFTRK